MMKHILSVQDLSCVGRCSLTVALPVISAMGIRCSVLPTAVLSTHTAFPKPEVVSLTDSLPGFARHWQDNGITFDGISLGYLSDPDQAAAVAAIVDGFPCPVILDPVMGDHGKLYSRITSAHIEAMRSLCGKAEVVLPNVTEAAALSGMDYRAQGDESYYAALGRGILALGAKHVVITGVERGDEIGWFYVNQSEVYSRFSPRIPRQFHGTGDLFAAVFAGSYLTNANVIRSAQKAADFVAACVAGTEVSTPHGVEFELQLPLLREH